MPDPLATRFAAVAPECDAWTLRSVNRRQERIHVRRGLLQPVGQAAGHGAMVTIVDGGGIGYAATTDLSASGLRACALSARDWARRTAMHSLAGVAALPRFDRRERRQSSVLRPWDAISLADKIALVMKASDALRRPGDARGANEAIVDWQAALEFRRTETLLLSGDGGEVEQIDEVMSPGLLAVANEGTNTQTRSFGWGDYARQGGMEILDSPDLQTTAERVGAEVLALLHAPECPSGRMSLLLMPSQMLLQIHESIGHPLELDRILGDERNYAGESFVTLDMFGSYRYGSELLNVTFDPTERQELASYAFDDEGTAAHREFLIREGILLRALGGASSQARAGVAGVANARACDWNRPPIDRMANLNLEPGASSLDDLIGSIEHGILMETNRSWSIDHCRNKFQFGCELGRRIVNGELGDTVRNPSYRGISASFWRSLVGVGDPTTRHIMGTLYCGKGEPNQAIAVGHAAPACVFRDVDVFGGS